jgi:alpha 1,3-mannosyltransferase
LPIQVAYAGDEDLSLSNRQTLAGLVEDIEFLDVLSVLDNRSMQLDRSWAIKPFAVLASKYEQVILLDADVVFLQPPESLLSHTGYQETGTLFFHDRLLWQHAFSERHKWWKEQMKDQKPSAALSTSLVRTQDYAEEADSGVVVMDKSRLPIFTGLLHICWQNTKAVREEATYTTILLRMEIKRVGGLDLISAACHTFLRNTMGLCSGRSKCGKKIARMFVDLQLRILMRRID